MSKVVLHACDKYDRENRGEYYLYRDNRPIEYTDNPWPQLHKADKIEIDTLDFKASELACIANCLVSEGYEPYYKAGKEGYVFGCTMYFRISKENKAKLRKNLQ